jgi:hypothetical protein
LLLPFQYPSIEFLQFIIRPHVLLLEVTEALDYIIRAEGVVVHLISDEGNLIAELLLFD